MRRFLYLRTSRDGRCSRSRAIADLHYRLSVVRTCSTRRVVTNLPVRPMYGIPHEEDTSYTLLFLRRISSFTVPSTDSVVKSVMKIPRFPADLVSYPFDVRQICLPPRSIYRCFIESLLTPPPPKRSLYGIPQLREYFVTSVSFDINLDFYRSLHCPGGENCFINCGHVAPVSTWRQDSIRSSI